VLVSVSGLEALSATALVFNTGTEPHLPTDIYVSFVHNIAEWYERLQLASSIRSLVFV
jgi:hypothetical protein